MDRLTGRQADRGIETWTDRTYLWTVHYIGAHGILKRNRQVYKLTFLNTPS